MSCASVTKTSSQRFSTRVLKNRMVSARLPFFVLCLGIFGITICCCYTLTNKHKSISRQKSTLVYSAPRDDDGGALFKGNEISFVDTEESNSPYSSLQSIGISLPASMKPTIIPQHAVSNYNLFCNRELNLDQIEAIGFDMDWTLAQYNEDFDLLAYNGAKEKLVSWFNYPKEVLDLKYNKNLCRRGCIIDVKRGNVIKLDRHKYVHAAEHGLSALSSAERKSIYKNIYLGSKESWYKGKGFVNIDTPFSLVDACLYMQLVDMCDNIKTDVKIDRTYEEIYSDMRRCIDRCHKDGVIKLKVAEDPSKYITYDPNIFPMLDTFRKSGRKVFLLTNSLYDYTEVVMNYLEGRKSGDKKDQEWMKYFDVVIVGGNKPFFLVDEKSLALFRVNADNQRLENIDKFPEKNEINEFLAKGKLFQGGNAPMLHKLLQLKHPDRVLYVGDHVYADILRSKRSLGWRTCLIIPELVEELVAHRKANGILSDLMQLRKDQFLLENELQSAIEEGSAGNVSQLTLELTELRLTIRRKLEVYNKIYHPRYGPLFKTGFKESRFAKQIKDYACIYTSRTSNLDIVSTSRILRPVRDFLPHDHFIEGL